MQIENVKEYETIRNELQELKKCITDYMGFALRGSGLALVGLAAVTSFKNESLFVYASFSISLILTYVLLVLIYKFNSHNFQAGYCKLLNKELWSCPKGYKSSDLIAWEWAIDLLRACDMQPNRLERLIGNLTPDLETREGKRIQEIADTIRECSSSFHRDPNGRFPDEDKITYRRERAIKNNECIRKGFILLGRSMTRFKIHSWSWQFPVWVTAVFFLINSIFLAIGFYYAIPVLIDSFVINVLRESPEVKAQLLTPSDILWFVFTFVVLSQIIIWTFIAGKIHRLMNGDSTVDAFYWRFIPIRSYILSKSNIDLVKV